MLTPPPLPPKLPKTRVPKKKKKKKPKVIYCRALLYTLTLWHRATRASICLCTFRISLDDGNTHQSAQKCVPPRIHELSPRLSWTSRGSNISALPVQPFSLTRTHTVRFTETLTHTYIHKAQWIELWSKTSMNTPNCLVTSTVQKNGGAAVPGKPFPGGDGSPFMSPLSSSSQSPYWPNARLFLFCRCFFAQSSYGPHKARKHHATCSSSTRG